MRLTHAAAIILAIALTLIASFSVQKTTAAQTDCVQALTAATTEGSWTADCTSNISAPSGSGDRYASFYTFTLDAESDVTINLSSDEDAFLYLRSGTSTDGSALHENDDYNYPASTDSRIVETLSAGSYTIEATTYTPGLTGNFTLTTTGIDFTTPGDPDRAALIALYHATNGDDWTDNQNWLTDAPLGEWQGVTTNDDGRVTELVFEGINLSGQIPSEIGNLSELEKLIFLDNELTGEIPTELGNLTRLKLLDLGHNEFTGTIPTWLGNLLALERLFLHNNQFTGTIPSELSTLGNLKDLHLHGNQLAGTIPPKLGELRNLGSLWVHNNQLKGEIPAELGELSNLLYMGLDKQSTHRLDPD